MAVSSRSAVVCLVPATFVLLFAAAFLVRPLWWRTVSGFRPIGITRRDQIFETTAQASSSQGGGRYNGSFQGEFHVGEHNETETNNENTANEEEINPADYPLSIERMRSIATDNYIIVTWANFHYLDFAVNWVVHLVANNISAFAVGAMDGEILESLVQRRINTFSMESNLTISDFGWGSTAFHAMGRQKVDLIYAFTKMGMNVIIADVDCVWLRNPIDYFKKYQRADILASSDHLASTMKDEGLEDWPRASSQANIGVLMMRPKEAVLALVEEWLAVLTENDQLWDQNAFNEIFRKGVGYERNEDPDRLFSAYGDKLMMGILPVALFCSGHTFFVQRMPYTLGLEPYVVHATYQFSGTPGKKHRMRESLLWNDEPEYFDTPNGFIAFDFDIPDDMLKSSAPEGSNIDISDVQGHFALINHQLRQLRDAFAIATALDRTLIIPQVWCGLDRWWSPHSGRIPGSNFELPFPCPLDHLLDLESIVKGHFSREMPEDEFGPYIDIRESSFLRNPRLPESVNATRLVVEVCEDEDQACKKRGHSGGDTSISIPPGLNDQQLRETFESAEQNKLIYFSSMLNTFGNFSDASDFEKFQKRTKFYTSIWCCTHEDNVPDQFKAHSALFKCKKIPDSRLHSAMKATY
ncbi:hypothetical protein BSKO_04802 [Bryopsis sp. KO-2023]|nr:hypothetical protein BSKO_04802 [Bryopsis sp. KO-2023]